MTLKILPTQEVLETDDLNGVYYIYKKNCVGEFSFGLGGSYGSSGVALEHARAFVSGRKDSDQLVIRYINR